MAEQASNWPPTYDDAYLPPAGARYWFPEIETMASASREVIIFEKLRGQTAWAYERSPFYRRTWDAAGFHPSQLNALDDLHRIPVITKEDLRQDLLDNPPFGSNVCDDWAEIERIHGSSGTTGSSLF